MKKVRLSWQDVHRCVAAIVGQLDRDYDCMLAITRGGLVPACLISEQIGLRNILAAAVMFYTGVDQQLESPVFLQFPSDPLLAGKKILVVDDVWDSGRTILAVKARIEAVEGRPSLAVLHFKPARSQFPGVRPDFFGEERNEWLVYPWDPASRYQRTAAPRRYVRSSRQ